MCVCRLSFSIPIGPFIVYTDAIGVEICNFYINKNNNNFADISMLEELLSLLWTKSHAAQVVVANWISVGSRNSLRQTQNTSPYSVIFL